MVSSRKNAVHLRRHAHAHRPKANHMIQQSTMKFTYVAQKLDIV